MNYYEHHLGDYAQATAHLSMLEDACYSRMLRWYYAEEKPLPAELRAVCRIVRASTEDEREAVRIVLEEFFVLEADGWHQKRADQEIERYRAKSEKARRSAGARWSASGSQCESDAKNAAPALPSHSERNANASAKHANASKPDANAMLTSHQTPDLKETALPPQASAAEPEADPRKTASLPLPGAALLTSAPLLQSPPGDPPPAPRAKRLPDDWVLTRPLAEEGAKARADAGLPALSVAEMRAEGAKFADYWRAKSGKDATKLDWTATWRNWCRSARASGQAGYSVPPPAAPREPSMEEITV